MHFTHWNVNQLVGRPPLNSAPLPFPCPSSSLVISPAFPQKLATVHLTILTSWQINLTYYCGGVGYTFAPARFWQRRRQNFRPRGPG